MYTDYPPTEKCFRASWSMILAFGSHYTGASSNTLPLEETEGWRYFSTAHDRLPDLLQGSNLSALQALLLIVSVVSGHYFQCPSRNVLAYEERCRSSIFSLQAGRLDGCSWVLVLRWLKLLDYTVTLTL